MRLAWLLLIACVCSGVAGAEPDADVARATELYGVAEQELADGKLEDALRDYTAALELTSDPVLYFKIGNANARLGRCEEARRNFQLYLANAHPVQEYVELSEQRQAACSAAAGAGDTGSGSSAQGSDDGSPLAPTPAPAGSAAPAEHASHGRDAAWIAVAGTVALLTTGAVLAFATSSSEQDVKDLYAGFDGTPPVFTSSTQQRYQDLLDEGHRYEYLSWISFGLAAATATTATILFVRSPHDSEHHARVTPVVSPQLTGVAASLSF